MLDEVRIWFAARSSGRYVIKGTVETTAHIRPAARARVASPNGLFEAYFFLALITHSHNKPPLLSFSSIRRFVSAWQAVPLLTFFKPDLLISLVTLN